MKKNPQVLMTLYNGKSKNKPYVKIKQGFSFYRIGTAWHYLIRVVDRRNNNYREHITDVETGEIVREIDVKLTDHQDRGDAKYKNKKKSQP